MKRFAFTSMIAAALSLGGVQSEARAQEVEVQGPLADAPAVIGLRVYRESRFQVQFHTGMTLQDEYSRSYLLGGQVQYHLTDWLGLGVWGSYAFNSDTGLTREIAKKGQTNDQNVLSLPDASLFPDQIGHIQWILAPQISFIPLRGKLSIFEKIFIDTDFYLFGGLGFVGVEERADVSSRQVETCNASGSLAASIPCFSQTVTGSGSRTSRVAIAPTFGAGLSLYVTNFVSVIVEWRALPFSWNTSGTDESGYSRGDFPDERINSEDRLFHFNHMLTLGVSMFLPTSPKRSQAHD